MRVYLLNELGGGELLAIVLQEELDLIAVLVLVGMEIVCRANDDVAQHLRLFIDGRAFWFVLVRDDILRFFSLGIMGLYSSFDRCFFTHLC